MSSLPPTHRAPARTPAWLWPHVLSLEAPLVAMLWLAALADINDLALMPGVLPGLGLTVWLIYLTDRLLDTWGVPADSLSLRHLFYHRYRWLLILLVIPLNIGLVVWLSLWVVPSGLLAQSLTLVPPIILYLVLYSITSGKVRRWLIQAGMLLVLLFVNALPISFGLRIICSVLIAAGTVLMISLRWHEHLDRYFRKEVAAGLLFAFGCTTWTRFHTLGSEGPENWVEFILLGLLFTANLLMITAHEDGQDKTSSNTRGTVISAIVITLLAAAAIQMEFLPASLSPLTWAVLGGLILLEILARNGQAFSQHAFRVWADIAVAVPALFLLLSSAPARSLTAVCCP